MNLFYDKNYYNKIDNPMPNAAILSCIISEKEQNGSLVKLIQVLKKDANDYETIYEKSLDKVYKTEKSGLVASQEERLKCCKPLLSDETTCIFAFIGYDKKALEIFNEYLRTRTVLSKQEIQEVKTNILPESKKEFIFEEFKEVINNPYKGDIQSFYVQTKKGINIYERNIKVKINDEWRNIYYTLFDENTTISEMVLELSNEQIETIKSFISKRALKELEIYLKRCNKHNNPIKK